MRHKITIAVAGAVVLGGATMALAQTALPSINPPTTTGRPDQMTSGGDPMFAPAKPPSSTTGMGRERMNRNANISGVSGSTASPGSAAGPAGGAGVGGAAGPGGGAR